MIFFSVFVYILNRDMKFYTVLKTYVGRIWVNSFYNFTVKYIIIFVVVIILNKISNRGVRRTSVLSRYDMHIIWYYCIISHLNIIRIPTFTLQDKNIIIRFSLSNYFFNVYTILRRHWHALQNIIILSKYNIIRIILLY